MADFQRVINIIPAQKVAAASSSIFTYLVPPRLHNILRPGMVVRVPLRRSEVLGVVSSQEMHRLPADTKKLKEVLDHASEIPPLDEKRLTLANWMAQKYFSALGQTLKLMLPRVPARVREQELVGRERQTADFVLTEHQRSAASQLGAALGKPGIFFLGGPSGSGKSEVYERAIERALAGEKQILILVPQIDDANALIAPFARRFGVENLCILHSAISPAERAAAWRSVHEGRKKIIIATRSGVLAPFADLGLIVVEREHDDSFVEEQMPRYDAREAAIELSRLWSCPTILVDHIPSLRAYFQIREKQITLLPLPNPVKADRHEPTIKIIDLSSPHSRARGENLGDQLRYALEENIRAKRQAILILNRRGGGTLLCPDCGYTPKCPSCEVSLIWFEARKKLQCRQCGHTEDSPARCPSCLGPGLRVMRYGTQSLEQEVRAIVEKTFPQSAHLVGRLDADTAKDKKNVAQIHKDWDSGKMLVLVGTQLIGSRFASKSLGLVGVVSADSFLAAPHYRALENAFTDFADMSGLLTRAKPAGTLYIQTFRAEHPLFERLKHFDYQNFYEQELSERKKFHYPPFVRLLRVNITGGEPRREAAAVTEKLRGILPAGSEIIGPTPPAGTHDQWELLVKFATNAPIDSSSLRRAVGGAELDPDPAVRW